MKKILYSSLAVCLLAFTSCDKDYLEVQPTDAIAEESAFTSTKNGYAALNGIHRGMFMQYSSQDQAGQGSVMINMDMLGEDLVMTTAGNGWFNSTYKWLTHRNANAGTVRFVYRFYYKIIANANMIISHIDNASGPQAEKDEIKGQALAYRAWAHHQLVQTFAERYDAGSTNDQLGVPIMTINTIEGQPRATVAEVYTQINADIDAAIALLPEDGTRNAKLEKREKSQININVAKGIKARVALTMQDWATAAQFAEEARQGFTLMSNDAYLAGFNDVKNPEWIWGSQQIADQTTYFYSFFAYMSANFSSTHIRTNPKAINSQLYAQIPETDVRKKLWHPVTENIALPSNFSRQPYMSTKFRVAGESSIGDLPYIRAAEMYLIEAEAKARMGQDAAAAEALYTLVSSRDPAYTLSVNTGQALLDEILVQRRIELWGEGFRFFDLKRTNSALDRTGANHSETLTSNLMEVEAGSNEWQWLIPQDELNANPQMVQNPL